MHTVIPETDVDVLPVEPKAKSKRTKSRRPNKFKLPAGEAASMPKAQSSRTNHDRQRKKKNSARKRKESCRIPPQPLLGSRYEALCRINETRHSEVIRVEDTLTRKTRIIKVLPRCQASFIEVAVMNMVRHPHLVRLKDVFVDNGLVHLVMRSYPGTLLERMDDGPIPESELRVYFRQILGAIRAMHQCGFVHKDIKLENILLHPAKKRCYLTDFGFSQVYDPSRPVLRDRKGSVHYASPELWRGEPYVGPEVDVWALGVLLYVCAVGAMPFPSPSLEQISTISRSSCFHFPWKLSFQLSDLILRMLTYESAKRISIDDIAAHPWLDNGQAIGQSMANSMDAQLKKGRSEHSTPNDDVVAISKTESNLNKTTKYIVGKSQRRENLATSSSKDSQSGSGLFSKKDGEPKKTNNSLVTRSPEFTDIPSSVAERLRDLPQTTPKDHVPKSRRKTKIPRRRRLTKVKQ